MHLNAHRSSSQPIERNRKRGGGLVRLPDFLSMLAGQVELWTKRVGRSACFYYQHQHTILFSPLPRICRISIDAKSSTR